MFDNKHKYKLNMDIKRDIELLFEVGCFRFVSRSWKRFLAPLAANNAEHTLRVAWTALILAKYEKGANLEKILKMAIVHDLPESRCGDVDYLSRQYTERNEKMALEDILKDTSCGKEMAELWQEYEDKKSIEAKIVKDADNLDVELELREFREFGSTLPDNWGKIRKEKVFPKLFTESAKKFWEEINNVNLHDWHLKGRNRFNTGDWKK